MNCIIVIFLSFQNCYCGPITQCKLLLFEAVDYIFVHSQPTTVSPKGACLNQIRHIYPCLTHLVWQRFATILQWVSMTPFGRPVVPLEQGKQHRSSITLISTGGGAGALSLINAVKDIYPEFLGTSPNRIFPCKMAQLLRFSIGKFCSRGLCTTLLVQQKCDKAIMLFLWTAVS